MVVVCLPELFENIPTVCFGFVVFWLVLDLLVTDVTPKTYDFLTQFYSIRNVEAPTVGRSKETLLAG